MYKIYNVETLEKLTQYIKYIMQLFHMKNCLQVNIMLTSTISPTGGVTVMVRPAIF